MPNGEDGDFIPEFSYIPDSRHNVDGLECVEEDQEEAEENDSDDDAE